MNAEERVARMTAGELKKRYHMLEARSSKITDLLIADGLGNVRFSEIKENPGMHPKGAKYLELEAEKSNIFEEGKRRYGPALYSIDHLERTHRPLSDRIDWKPILQ